MPKQNRKYSTEFKQDAVNFYYSSGKSIEEAAKDLKVNRSSLNTWIQNAKQNGGTVNQRGSGNFSSDIEKENARLRKELRDAQDALEILKKAISILND